MLRVLAAIAEALIRIVDYFQKKEERAREIVPAPHKPTTVEEVERHRRAAAAAVARGEKPN